MGRNARRRRTPRKRTIRLDEQTADLLKAQVEKFRKKFGREPGPGDPIFFDPNADTPKPFDADVVDDALLEVLQKFGMPPALIHATMKTGMIVSTENVHQFSEEDLAEWQAALDEYAALQRRGTFD